jgi:capsular exopolysaccharide synthesis family protein
MDFGYLFNVLLRGKWLILAAIIAPAIAAYLYVNAQDRTYKSATTISTGLLDPVGINSEEATPYISSEMLDISFNNHVEKMQSESMKRLLSFKLLIHDLEGQVSPFRTLEEEESLEIQTVNLNNLVSALKEKIAVLDGSQFDRDMELNYLAVAKAYNYDRESIDDMLVVYRKGKTDLLGIDFETEDPFLSAYCASTLADLFLEVNKYEQEKTYLEDFEFAQNDTKKKKEILDSLRYTLNNYRTKHQLLDISKQAGGILGIKDDLESLLIESETNLLSSAESISTLDKYLSDADINIIKDKVKTINNNENIQYFEIQINILREDYIDNPDAKILAEIEALEEQKLSMMGKIADQESADMSNINKDLTKDLLSTKIENELVLASSRASKEAINKLLRKKNSEATTLLSHYSIVDKLTGDMNIASDAYDRAKDIENDKKVALDKAAYPLAIREKANVADEPQSSLKLVITAFSGVVGGTFATLALLMLAFMDNSLSNTHQFRKFSDIDLIGTLNELKQKNVNLKELFGSELNNQPLEVFKESIRSLRHEIEQTNKKSFLFTSTKEQQGKTFLIIMLAHALTLKGKRILLIDTNFKNNSLTRMFDENNIKNKLTSRLLGEANLDTEFETKNANSSSTMFSMDNVDILGNRGGMSSPSELFAGKEFSKLLQNFTNTYDYIFLEGPALNKYADSKELIEYVDKVITVFSASNSVDAADKKSITYLQKLNGKLMGAVLNKLELINLN